MRNKKHDILFVRENSIITDTLISPYIFSFQTKMMGKEFRNSEQIFVYLKAICEKINEIENKIERMAEGKMNNKEIITEEIATLNKIEVKVNNLHRIFELAKAGNADTTQTLNKSLRVKSRKMDLAQRKEKELARTLTKLKFNVNQS